MQLFCPACQSAFSGASRCPRCGGLLLMPHEVVPDGPHRPSEAPPPVATTFLGRAILGTVLALGLYLALHNLVTGAIRAVDSDPMAWWLSFRGLLAIHAAQVVAVVFGAAIAGASREKGYSVGLAVGGLCGGAFLAFSVVAGASPRDLVLYLQPPMLALFGLVAGAVGAWVWQPPPEIEYPVSAASKLSSIQLLEDSIAHPEPPTQWARVMIGALVMVIGVTVADDFRKSAQQHSAGMLRVQSLGQGEFVTWQLGMFSVLLGGIIAGASTSAGLRHGVFAGVLGGVGVYGMCAKAGTALPPMAWWLTRMALNEEPLDKLPVIATIISTVFLFGIIGGWMGGILFLKLAPEHMRRSIRPEL